MAALLPDVDPFAALANPCGATSCPDCAVEVGTQARVTFILHTTVTWELSPDGDDTLLVMTHGGFDPDSHADRQAFEGVRGGGPTILERPHRRHVRLTPGNEAGARGRAACPGTGRGSVRSPAPRDRAQDSRPPPVVPTAENTRFLRDQPIRPER